MATPVTIVDRSFTRAMLDELHNEIPESRNLLRHFADDMSNSSALAVAISYDIVGAIHLGAASQEAWCLEHEAACPDVTERGTELVLDALGSLMHRTGSRPCIYARSMLRAEKALSNHIAGLREAGLRAGSLYSVVLRLSELYGVDVDLDFIQELVPRLITQALSHLPIQILDGDRLVTSSVEDCVNGMLLAIQQLASLSFSVPALAPRNPLEKLDISSGANVTISEPVEKATRLTRLKSPIQFAGCRGTPRSVNISSDQARQTVIIQPDISVDEGLRRLVHRYLERTQYFLRDEIARRAMMPLLCLRRTAILKIWTAVASAT